ncbi:hypothetical protein BY996DRAFT_6439845 [Phakopsora pachyrhizi]|uniref:Uncharacterized protein n=1 Tax=Phakopsora pachyrhizi TaxID=170000 RepID=A0AAV0AKF4_PHAPC|nr:hypothetical protein BY996DRAFT_6439845 [Phakopsora pachyrhizi]CAH7668285.1 hypothetical protein PPACK8108_LOCUS2768 [Phakopsora pachyrhizi]
MSLNRNHLMLMSMPVGFLNIWRDLDQYEEQAQANTFTPTGLWVLAQIAIGLSLDSSQAALRGSVVGLQLGKEDWKIKEKRLSQREVRTMIDGFKRLKTFGIVKQRLNKMKDKAEISGKSIKSEN